MDEQRRITGGSHPALARRAQAVAGVRRATGGQTASAPAVMNGDEANAQLVHAARLRTLGDLDGAQAACHRALADDPACADAHAELARIALAGNRVDDARAHASHAVRACPGRADLRVTLGEVCLANGDREEAARAFRSALDVDPSHTFAALRLANARRFRPGDDDLALLRALTEKHGADPPRLADVLFALAKTLDDTGDVDAAMAHYARANAIAHRIHPFDRNALASLVTRIGQVFNRNFLERVGTQWSDDDARPVLVVGMPRSGSTLVEQILCAHPAVDSAGETLAFETAIGAYLRGPFPETIPELDATTARDIARDYVARLAGRGAASRVIDKRPGNYVAIGLLALLLPRATVIDCRRDPLDTGLSCYVQPFKREQPFSTDLHDIGCCYRLYEALMAHWTRTLPGRVVSVRYETLVTDFASEARRLVDACGLAWDERCMRPEAVRRHVATASAPQVLEPVHGNAVGRWRRVAHHLDPLRRGLDDGAQLAASILPEI